MCGISGIINLKNNSVQESNLKDMMLEMKHRGPDDDGVYLNKNIGLGFVRLSIIDLTKAGHQPMFSHDKKYVLIFNGEIFNYIELREELKNKGYKFYTDTDTEVLINSYIEWGEECQHKFNGMWAFAIYNTENGNIFISRDRYGIKPLYVYQNEEIFAFASEIPSLLKVINKKPQANMEVIFDYLAFNRTDQTENTFFENIHKLQHGYCLKIDTINNNVLPKPQKWYDLKEKVNKRRSTRFEESDFKILFSDAIKLRLRSDVPVGVCFSGGLDSSAIVSTLLKEFNKKELNTFSAVYKKGETGDESKFIKLYEDELKNMFYTTPDSNSLLKDMKKFIKTHAEPIPSTGPYAQYKVMELASKNVVVTLDGQGADEMLAGYLYFFGFFFKDLFLKLKWFKLTKELFFYLKIHKSLIGIKAFVYFLLPVKLRTKIRVNEKGYINKDFADKYSSLNSIAGNLYEASSLNEALLNHFEYKLEHLLKWEDKNSMAFSLEARVPFLDHRLVELILSVDGERVIKNGMTKNILRNSMQGVLPEKIRLRVDKTGFETPQDKWYRENEFQKLIANILSSESFRKRKIIDSDKANKLYQKHLSSEKNISKEIWKWIHLELWFREFIDEPCID
jgi:asparagine synthase (glutamine-hydrolysing)